MSISDREDHNRLASSLTTTPPAEPVTGPVPSKSPTAMQAVCKHALRDCRNARGALAHIGIYARLGGKVLLEVEVGEVDAHLQSIERQLTLVISDR